jgi:hypothetical protein
LRAQQKCSEQRLNITCSAARTAYLNSNEIWNRGLAAKSKTNCEATCITNYESTFTSDSKQLCACKPT